MRKKSIDFLNSLALVLKTKKLLGANQSVLLSVSGGQDSICLFFICIQLQKQWNWKIFIIWCNHLWQNNSFYSLKNILNLGILFNVFISFSITSIEIYSEQKARNWRYNTIQRLAWFLKNNAILTAHTGSDRVETILFQLIRGSGPKAYSFLQWHQVIDLPIFKFSSISNSYKFLFPTHFFCFQARSNQLISHPLIKLNKHILIKNWLTIFNFISSDKIFQKSFRNSTPITNSISNNYFYSQKIVINLFKIKNHQDFFF